MVNPASGRAGRYAARVSFRESNGVYLADTARVVGDVTIGDGSSLWYGAVVRGDVAAVTIGQRCNVQDNATIHCDAGRPNVLGDRVSVGHNAVVHGVAVGDGSLVGMGARLLGGSVVGRGCLIAAGAVVPPGLTVPDGMLAVGVPARVTRPVSDKERAYLQWLPTHYAELAKQHAAGRFAVR